MARVLFWDDERIAALATCFAGAQIETIAPAQTIAALEQGHVEALVLDLARLPDDGGARIALAAARADCCVFVASLPPSGELLARLTLAQFDAFLDLSWPPLLIARCVALALERSRTISTYLETQSWMNETAVEEVSSLKALSEKDELTELWNRRSFEHIFQKEHARASRFGRPYSIVFIDLDDLRALNGKFGHIAGSAAIKCMARVCKELTRQCDYPFRYGGDELVILLIDTDKAGAKVYGTRLVETIRATPVDYEGGRVSITLSVGIATFPADGDNMSDILRHADAALYAAKEKGKNCLVLFEHDQ